MPWIVNESDLAGLSADARSTIFTVGNGRFCTRGTAADAYLTTAKPYPYRATLLAGCFTRAGWGLDWLLGGPDWTAASLHLPEATVEGLTCSLDLRRGVLTRTWRLTTPAALVECSEERFASWAHPFLAVQRLSLRVARGPVEEIRIFSGLDGDVRSSPSKEYKPGRIPNCDERGLRLSQVESAGASYDQVNLVLRARSTGNRINMAARIQQTVGNLLHQTVRQGDTIGFAFRGRLCAGDTVWIDKAVAIAADLDGQERAEQAPAYLAALSGLNHEALCAEHARAISAFWEVAGMQMQEDPVSTRALHFAIWTTRIAANLDGGRSSIGPKNLTGEWYRGLLFWDMDLFQAPLLAALSPERARNHVRYRHRLLAGARVLARQDGYDGARFPFSAPPDGLERPMCLRGIHGQQLHVNLAAAQAILHTWTLTGNDEVLTGDGGLEVLLELARFWLSAVQGPDEANLFHLPDLTGPDELHHGVDDNWYTNAFLGRHLMTLLEVLAGLRERDPSAVARITALVGWTVADESRARQVGQAMFLPSLPDGRPAQFARFEQQPEPDCSIRNQWGIGDCTHKQADTVLLAQVFPRQTGLDWLATAYDTYVPLCTQTSSLSPGSHALAAARLGREEDAVRFFQLATGMELEDSFANTAHGVHGAGQGGLWIAAVQGFGGLQVDAHGVAIDPCLPPRWPGLDYAIHLQGGILAVSVRQDAVSVHRRQGGPVNLVVMGQNLRLESGQQRQLPCRRTWQPARLRAVLLDLDGVLVSTDHCHFAAWKELADELGIPFDEHRNHLLRGVSREESLRRIYGERPLPEPAVFKTLCDRKNARYRQLVDGMGPAEVLPGMRELLIELRRRGLRLAIASASRNTRLVLERTGLLPLVDVVADGTMVTASKPDPQVFALAAMRCRALPWECIGVEDAAAGVEAIRRAGVVSVGVGDQAKDAQAWVSQPQQITADLLEQVFRQHRDLLNPYRELNLAKLRTELGQ